MKRSKDDLAGAPIAPGAEP